MGDVSILCVNNYTHSSTDTAVKGRPAGSSKRTNKWPSHTIRLLAGIFQPPLVSSYYNKKQLIHRLSIYVIHLSVSLSLSIIIMRPSRIIMRGKTLTHTSSINVSAPPLQLTRSTGEGTSTHDDHAPIKILSL